MDAVANYWHVPLALQVGSVNDPATDCEADERYVRNVHLLAVLFCVLSVLCGVTLVTRAWASRFSCLPLYLSHVNFLVLIFLLSTVRIIDLQWQPCPFMLERGARQWLKNLLGAAPMMISTTVFMLLLYHVLIVLHSIQLVYEPLLRGCERSLSFIDVRQVSPRMGVHDERCCHLRCSFWFIMLGRPHSTCKWLVAMLIAGMWVLFAIAFLVDSVHGDSRRWFDVFLAALELPSIVMAFLIGSCFVVSGVLLLRRLQQLQTLLEAAGADIERNDEAVQVTFIGPGSMLSERPSPRMSGIHGSISPSGVFDSGSTMDPSGFSRSVTEGAQPCCQAQGSAECSCSRPGDVHSQEWTSSVVEIIFSEGMPLTPAGAAATGGSSHIRSFSGIIPRGASSPSASVLQPQSRRSLISLHGSQVSTPTPHRLTQASRATVTSTKSATTTASSVAAPADEVITSIPKVETVCNGVRRMLAVVMACVVAFLWRGVVLCYVWRWRKLRWPGDLFLWYIVFSEVVPIAMLLILYLLPGLNAICLSHRCTVRQSVVESV